MKTRMKTWGIFGGLLMSVAAVGGCARSDATVAEDASNMKCVRRLQLPAYASIAQSARVMGSLTAATGIAQNGGVQSIAFEGASGARPDLVQTVFGPEIEKALKASRFDESCAGRTVRMTFVFGMDRNPARGTWFEFPNRFEIGVESPIVNTNTRNR